MDPARKRRLGIIAFLPLVAVLAAVVNHLLVLSPIVRAADMQDQIAVVTRTSEYFTRVAIFYAIAGFVVLSVLIYDIIHVARLKNLGTDYKFFWSVFLTMFSPISFIVFWYFKIRREPRELNMYPSL